MFSIVLLLNMKGTLKVKRYYLRLCFTFYMFNINISITRQLDIIHNHYKLLNKLDKLIIVLYIYSELKPIIMTVLNYNNEVKFIGYKLQKILGIINPSGFTEARINELKIKLTNVLENFEKDFPLEYKSSIPVLNYRTKLDDIKYKIVNGTAYHKETGDLLIKTLENARINKFRIIVDYGDVKTGESWNETLGITGYVSRSNGDVKIPILVYNSRCYGSGALLDHCIIKVVTAKGKIQLYPRIT